MTVLGQAFIEVHGDMKPFIRDLDKQVKKAVENAEKQITKGISKSVRASGTDTEQLGTDIGSGVDKGMRKKLGDKNKSPWVQIAAALGSALDDGLSALPSEVKAAIVVGLIATLPFISAGLAGAASAGLAVAFTGLGVLIASQYEEVQAAAASTGEIIRLTLARAAEPFADAVVKALNLISDFFLESEDVLGSLFDTAASFVVPLTNAILDALNVFLRGIDEVDGELGKFVDELGDAIFVIATGITEAFKILVNTGEEGREGLRDMALALSLLITGAARLIAIFTELYGLVRDFALAVPILFPFTAAFFKLADENTQVMRMYTRAELELTGAIKGTLAPTEAQEKAIKEAAQAMDQARDSAFGLVDAQIDYEESLDRLNESLKENGKTLSFETDKGRENLRRLGDAIKKAQQDNELRLASGKVTAEQAAALYQQEIQEILNVARAHGVTEQAIRDVYGEAIQLVNIPKPKSSWLDNLAAAAAKAAEQLERAKRAAQSLGRGPKGSGGGFTGFAEGGIITSPTMAVLGEGGRPEVVIPLTNPRRAAQLAEQSGLMDMMAKAVTLVQVFLGTEQLEQRMYRVVQDNNSALASSVAFGARGL